MKQERTFRTTTVKPLRAVLRSFIRSKMEKAKIDRINELGRIAKERELTEAEQKERQALREEYIAYFRAEIRKGKEENK